MSQQSLDENYRGVWGSRIGFGKSPALLLVDFMKGYVLPGSVFEAIKRTKPGSGGEIQLTDAMAALLDEGTPVHAIVYRGTRYDTGMPLGYLQAVVQLAVQRDDLGPAFRNWLGEFVKSMGSGGSA